jgi:hypothetical protein
MSPTNRPVAVPLSYAITGLLVASACGRASPGDTLGPPVSPQPATSASATPQADSSGVLELAGGVVRLDGVELEVSNPPGEVQLLRGLQARIREATSSPSALRLRVDPGSLSGDVLSVVSIVAYTRSDSDLRVLTREGEVVVRGSTPNYLGELRYRPAFVVDVPASGDLTISWQDGVGWSDDACVRRLTLHAVDEALPKAIAAAYSAHPAKPERPEVLVRMNRDVSFERLEKVLLAARSFDIFLGGGSSPPREVSSPSCTGPDRATDDAALKDALQYAQCEELCRSNPEPASCIVECTISP